MVAFEKYHPLLSPHYTLDWPTASRLKDLYALRADATQAALSARPVAQSITETAHAVNHAMRLIMGNQALIYGVTTRKDHALAGSVALLAIDPALTQAQLQVEVAAPTAPAPFYDEIVPRVVGFAFFELGLTTLKLSLPLTPTPLQTWLVAHGFAPTATGERLMLTITEAAVADDPHYHF